MMKKITYLILLCSVAIYSQNNPANRCKITADHDNNYAELKMLLQRKLDAYCTEDSDVNGYKAADSVSFLKQIKNIFNTVIVNNTDAVNNGSAFSYSQDKDKHTFSANATFARKEWDYTMFDVGTNITSADDRFNYYSKGKWANDIGAKVGFNLRFSATQFVLDTTCQTTKLTREVEMMQKLFEIKEALMLKMCSEQIKDSIRAQTTLYRDMLSVNSRSYNSIKNAAYKKSIETYRKQLKIIEKFEWIADPARGINDDDIEPTEHRQYDNIKSLMNLDSISENERLVKEKIAKYATVLITTFDDKHDDFHGYRIWWFNTNYQVSNNAFKIKGDSLMIESLQKRYTSRMKSAIEFSLNMNHSARRAIQFMKLYTSVNQVSFLDSPNLVDVSLFVIPDNPETPTLYNVANEDGEIFGKYENVRDWKYAVNIGGYYANLFLFDKTLGLNIKANINAPMFHNIGMLYERNYSLTAGLIFRMVSETKFSKATFMINGGVENQLFHENGFDRFILKASVGVPFSVFERAKPDAKKS